MYFMSRDNIQYFRPRRGADPMFWFMCMCKVIWFSTTLFTLAAICSVLPPSSGFCIERFSVTALALRGRWWFKKLAARSKSFVRSPTDDSFNSFLISNLISLMIGKDGSENEAETR